MFEYEFLGILLGILQGLFEWLPISSEGQIVIVLVQIIDISIADATSLAFFAHIGTSLVVFLFYRKEYLSMIKTAFNLIENYFTIFIFNYVFKNEIDQKNLNQIDLESKKLLKLVIIVTIFTLPTALLSLIFIEALIDTLNSNLNLNLSEIITLLVGVFLVLTGIILKYRTKLVVNITDNTKFEDISLIQAIILGILQGFTAIPGISRSGLTVTYLLLGSKLNQNESLRASFIVGAPVTLGAGFLQVLRGKISFIPEGMANESGVVVINYIGALLMIVSAFIIGVLTLKGFLELAKKVRFDYFLIIFGSIAIIAIIIGFLV